MATITDATLAISHDHRKKLATPVVTCKVNFTGLELCLMKSCAKERMFKLKCQLWGQDGFFTGPDNILWVYDAVYYFPDASPTSPESRKFEVIVGEGVLDEDWGEDEIYGKLLLQNLLVGSNELQQKTNVVHHSF